MLLFLLNSLNEKPNLIIITEVNPKLHASNFLESEFSINGYTMFCANVGIEKHRGIIIYVDNKLTAVEVDVFTTFSECVFVQIKNKKSVTITVGAFYRSPSSTQQNDESLYMLISNLLKQNKEKILLIGDFNFRNVNWENWTCSSPNISLADNKFIDCLQRNLLLQHVNFPTRARGSNSPHILDLIITNEDFVSNVINLSPLGKSDHSVIHCSCDNI